MNNQFRNALAVYFVIFIACAVIYYFNKSLSWLAYVLAALTVGGLGFFAAKMLRKK